MSPDGPGGGSVQVETFSVTVTPTEEAAAGGSALVDLLLNDGSATSNEGWVEIMDAMAEAAAGFEEADILDQPVELLASIEGEAENLNAADALQI